MLDRTRLIDRRLALGPELMSFRASRSIAAAAAFAAAAVACTPGTPPVTTPGGPRAGHPTAAPSKATPLPPRYSAGHFDYDVESVGIVSTPGDTTGRADTVTTRSTVSYDARPDSGRLRVAGRVVYRVVVTAGLRTPSPSAPRAAAAAPAATAAPA